jgi:hypothetical protein
MPSLMTPLCGVDLHLLHLVEGTRAGTRALLEGGRGRGRQVGQQQAGAVGGGRLTEVASRGGKERGGR